MDSNYVFAVVDDKKKGR